MGILTVLRMAYQFGKIASFFILFLAYFQWKTWRAKSAFKNELLKNGVPRELAANLADSYGNGNKNILGPQTTLLARMVLSRRHR